MKLLLFDIDGTLLTSNGAGRTAVQEALTSLLGRPVVTDGVSFSGRTDPQIMRELLATNGRAADDGLLDRALAAYAGAAQTALDPSSVEVLPGVTQLLDRLDARPDVQLGLLTGNVEPMAAAKLRAGRLAHHFPFGAYGSDHADRRELPAIALERAAVHTGRHFYGTDVVIVGDTEHDIRCGETLGVFTVAVCTGHFDRDMLARHEPDVLLDDLTEVDDFIDRVL